MVGTKRGIESEESRQSARHTLFVEGSDSDAIDAQALDFFFKDKEISIRVAPLASSSNIRAVAGSLYPYHHDYYFLIDRDHHDDETIERYWRNFPDENTHNLLIWRRREIENYFLIPEYLARSEHLICSPEELQQRIRETANKCAFLDIANTVVLKLKNELNKVWIEPFKVTEAKEFSERDKALAKLMEKYEAAKQTGDVLEKLCEYPISDRFTEAIDKFFGGQDELEFGHGSWLEMIRGKHVLPTVIRKCFRVKDATGRNLQGKECCMEVVKGLLRLPLENQPADFNELYKLISTRVMKRT
jgi:hypothetical protein